MSECCGGGCQHGEEQRDFWGWWRKKAEDEEVTFTLSEVLDLLEEVKEFNAGAIDKYLSKHVDRVLQEKLDQKNG